MGPDAPQSLRADQRTVQAYLDRLDCAARSPRGIDVRRCERFVYRPSGVVVDLTPGSATRLRYAVAPRNISREGLGFLAGRFVYPKTPCQLTLPNRYGDVEVVPAHAVRCRYLLGSGALYEVGVRFDRPIDVALFADHARPLRILLVDEDPARHRLLTCLLQPLRAAVTCVTMAADAAGAALGSEFELILLDLESPRFDAFATTRELRQAGYLGPIVGLAVQTGRSLYERCAAAGCTGYLRKPVTQEGLRALVESLMGEPIVSSLAADPAMAPLIDSFVHGLRAQMKELSRAFEHGDRETVQRIAREVRGAAGSYGFNAISEEAEHLEASAALDMTPERLRSAVYDLIHLCLAARPASAAVDGARPHDPAVSF